MRTTAPLGAALLVCIAAPAAADDLADYQRARNAYDTGDYATAVQRLGELLDREPPPSRAIREECLEYLGAAQLFLGRLEDARLSFEKLLVLEPDWAMDPAAFPLSILDEFERVKAEMRERLEALQQAEAQVTEQVRRQRAEEDRRRREALAAALAPRYLVREDSRRWLVLAFIPFGAGQFQNGQDTAGWTLLGVESGLFAANAWTFFAWYYYAREWSLSAGDDARRQQAQAYADGYKIASWTIFGALLATMVGGVIDALVAYEEPATTWRVVPPEQVPEGERLPVRSPDEFLPPPESSTPAEAPAAPPPVSLGLTLRF